MIDLGFSYMEQSELELILKWNEQLQHQQNTSVISLRKGDQYLTLIPLDLLAL